MEESSEDESERTTTVSLEETKKMRRFQENRVLRTLK